MTIHTREIYERIMLPMIKAGAVQVWHWPHLNRVEYLVTQGATNHLNRWPKQ